jgi:hypothetical protein
VRINQTTGKIIYNVNTTIDYGCDASTFLAALKQFDSFSNYQTSVVRNIYNGNTIINTLTGATRVDYVVSLFLLRSTDLSDEDFTYTKIDYDGAITKTPVTAHSPLITGNFSLSIGGVQFTDLPFDISESALESKIRTIVGY